MVEVADVVTLEVVVEVVDVVVVEVVLEAPDVAALEVLVEVGDGGRGGDCTNPRFNVLRLQITWTHSVPSESSLI